MRGWTLLFLELDWATGRLGIWLRDESSVPRRIFAEEVSDLHAPRASAEASLVIEGLAHTAESLEIRMRSGEVIRITARNILLPA